MTLRNAVVAAALAVLATFAVIVQSRDAHAAGQAPPVITYESVNAAFGTTSTTGILDTRKVDELQILVNPNPDSSVTRYINIDWLGGDSTINAGGFGTAAGTVIYRYSVPVATSTVVTSTTAGAFYSVIVGRDATTPSVGVTATPPAPNLIGQASGSFTVVPLMLGRNMQITLTAGTSTQWVWSASTTGAQGYNQFAVYGR